MSWVHKYSRLNKTSDWDLSTSYQSFIDFQQISSFFNHIFHTKFLLDLNYTIQINFEKIIFKSDIVFCKNDTL